MQLSDLAKLEEIEQAIMRQQILSYDGAKWLCEKLREAWVMHSSAKIYISMKEKTWPPD